MAASEEFVEHTTAAAVAEKAKLVKHFSRFDIMFFLICTLVGVDTIGAVAPTARGFFWLMALGLLFFFPYALLTAELGSAFTEEGGCYIWTKMAFGRFVACVNSVLYWLSNPVWVGGLLAIEAFQATNDFFFHMSSGSFWQYAFSILFIWFGIWAAILSFGIGKWIPTLGAFARIFLFAFFTITAILYGIKHGLHAPSFSNYKPTYAGFILLVPVLFFNYVGFELPNAAGDEMKDPQKDVPITVLRSMIASILLYGIPILAIILIVPAQQLSGVSGLSDALKIVFTVYGGSVHTAADGTVTATLTGFGKVMGDFAAACFILALLSSGTTWIMGSDRSQAVAGYDGCRAALAGHLLGPVRHPDRGQPAVRRGRHDHDDRRDPAGRRQQREVLQRRVRRGAAVHDHLLHRHLPDRHQAPLQPRACPPPVQGAGWHGRACGWSAASPRSSRRWRPWPACSRAWASTATCSTRPPCPRASAAGATRRRCSSRS